jgi:plastocyanin
MRVYATILFAACAIAFPARAYEAITVGDGATITGKVIFNGPVTTRKIITTKDQEVCGGIRDEVEIVVGADKGVQDTIVYLQGVTKGKAWPKLERAAVIDNVKCKFEPYVQVMAAGEVEIVNSDPVLHNTKAFYGRRSAFNIALPNKDQRIKAELPRPGEVRVECDAHGWMQGWVYVAESPYFAVTPQSGSFTITNIPPGSYTLMAFQPYTGTIEIPVTVKAKETAQVSVELKKK